MKFGIKQIDSRPSDAISIALRLNAQIYVSPEVIKEAGVNQEDISEESSLTPKYSIEDLELKLKKFNISLLTLTAFLAFFGNKIIFIHS